MPPGPPLTRIEADVDGDGAADGYCRRPRHRSPIRRSLSPASPSARPPPGDRARRQGYFWGVAGGLASATRALLTISAMRAVGLGSLGVAATEP